MYRGKTHLIFSEILLHCLARVKTCEQFCHGHNFALHPKFTREFSFVALFGQFS